MSTITNSGGYLKFDNKPFISLFRNVNATYTQDTVITGFRVNDSRGITYDNSTGAIQVPVGGLYQIGFHCITQSTGGVYVYINGSKIYRIGYAAAGSSEAWSHVGGTNVFQLSANDQVKFYAANSDLSLYGAQALETVGGVFLYLIG